MSSKSAHTGDKVAFRVLQDVKVNGKTLIAKGASAEGLITETHHRRSFGRKGEVKIKLSHVQDKDGKHVPLAPYKSGKRFSAGGPGAAGAGLLVFGPVGAVAGVFVKGKEITINKGTRIQAEVAGAKK